MFRIWCLIAQLAFSAFDPLVLMDIMCHTVWPSVAMTFTTCLQGMYEEYTSNYVHKVNALPICIAQPEVETKLRNTILFTANNDSIQPEERIVVILWQRSSRESIVYHLCR